MSAEDRKLTDEQKQLLRRAEAILRGCAEKEARFIEGPLEEEQERLNVLLHLAEVDYGLGS